MEKIKSEGLNDKQEKKPEVSASFIRHSKATYKTYAEILGSENPTSSYDHENQVTPDLSEAGVELAREEAEKYFSMLDPANTDLFFVSSNEARAVETATVYKETAKQKGFNVITPENPRSSLSEEIGDGEIRVLNGLSINSPHVLVDNVFQTPSKRNPINWEKVDFETKRKFEEASKIIEADDQGDFGPNYAKHSETIKIIFPEIKTAEELYEKQFRNIVRLFKFGVKKAEESGIDSKIKIVAFGHENYLLYALEKVFEEEGIDNCEVLGVENEGGVIVGKYRGKRRNIEN